MAQTPIQTHFTHQYLTQCWFQSNPNPTYKKQNKRKTATLFPSVFTCELACFTLGLFPIHRAASAPAPTAFTTQAAEPKICIRSSERSCCALVLLIGSEWESLTGPSCWGCLCCFYLFFSLMYLEKNEKRGGGRLTNRGEMGKKQNG